MRLLEVQDIHTYYGESHVLHGISLGVERGQIIAVAGRNGMGKTTLLNSIVGFNPPRVGTILFKGRDITRLRPFLISQLGMGFVPQGRRIFRSLTTKETIAIAMRKGASAWTLDRLLTIFPQLKKRLYARSGNLSGGEQQMLSISRALAGQPDLILMDEPSEGLAPLVVQEIGTVISEIKAQGISIVLVEQNLPFALELADYVYVMSKGTLVYGSEPNKLEENTDVKSRYLGI